MATDTIARAMAGNTKKELDNYKNNPDVADIVQTKADLDNYDTSKLSDNDIVKVLIDETRDNKETYYKWSSGQWAYVGGIGPFYTQDEIDNLLDGKVDKEDGKGLSTNDFTDSYKNQITTNQQDIASLQNDKQDALSGSTSIDITNNVVSVKEDYIDSQFLSNTERQDLIDEIMEVFENE